MRIGMRAGVNVALRGVGSIGVVHCAWKFQLEAIFARARVISVNPN
jgi:hypothetical protein